MFKFSCLVLCITLDLGTRVCTQTLQENIEPTILEVQCDRRRFSSKSETNLGFICLLLFYVSTGYVQPLVLFCLVNYSLPKA